jgi:hypothetical protein
MQPGPKDCDMINYSKNMPAIEDILMAISYCNYDLKAFLDYPICQFCGGKKTTIIALDGEWVCDCKIHTNRRDVAWVKSRHKHTNHILSLDSEQEIKESQSQWQPEIKLLIHKYSGKMVYAEIIEYFNHRPIKTWRYPSQAWELYP